MARLSPDFKYHATSLRAACLRPMLYKQEHPEFEVPTSLTALRGTVGHALLAMIHQGEIKFGEGDRYYADKFLALISDHVYALCDSETGWDVDGSGRVSFVIEDPADVRKWANQQMEQMGLILMQYCRWWRLNMGASPTAGVKGIEVPYHMELEGGKTKSPYIVTGLMDLIYEHPDLGMCLLDWKFGDYQRSHESQATLDMDYQLCTYALACREAQQLGGIENFVPDTVGWMFMGDLLPYARRTPITDPKYPTRSRGLWIKHLLESGRTHFSPGDLRGPVMHDTYYSDAILDQHKREMLSRMAATRMGGALVRVRNEGCSWCFWRDVCLEDWYGARAEEGEQE